ncbi:MAG: 2-hydroxyacid dehydrogenase [Fusobacteriota bacterium]
MKIAFFDTKPYDKRFFDKLNEDYGYDITYFDANLNESTVKLTDDFDVVCVFVNDNVNKKVIEELEKNGVKLIALRCAGYNNVDFQAARDRLHVVRVPGYSPNAIAEHTVGLMLSLNRNLHKAYYRIKDNNFSINGFLGFDMKGKTAGLIGTGKIAQVVIKILKGFDMNVIAYDPYPNEEAAKEKGYKYVELDELYNKSDIISLHCPLTPETKYIINKESIDKMKEGVMIINTGRGELINTKDLITGLKSRKIGNAGLDVYEEESKYFFEDTSHQVMDDDVLARLLTFRNVLVTSHQAFFTKEAVTNIAQTTLENIKSFKNGDKLKNEIAYYCDNKGCAIKDK